jgi:anti-anti-sigma regulatory factor
MLQLEIRDESSEVVVLHVNGRLVGDEVKFLEQEGRKHMCPSQRLTVDLDGVRFVDSAGAELLRGWAIQGVLLRGGSPFVRALLQTSTPD